MISERGAGYCHTFLVLDDTVCAQERHVDGVCAKLETLGRETAPMVGGGGVVSTCVFPCNQKGADPQGNLFVGSLGGPVAVLQTLGLSAKLE